jgi:hypothetical protein
MRFAAFGGSGYVFARSVTPCGRSFPRKNSATFLGLLELLRSSFIATPKTSYTLLRYVPFVQNFLENVKMT